MLDSQHPSQSTPVPPPEASADTKSAIGIDASLFVWAVWAIMLAMAYGFVARYGSGVLYEDDWVFVPILTGEQRFSLGWLWKQNNEHRFPLPNLVILSLYKLSGFDPRAGMYFTVTVLGLLSVLMIRTAARLRDKQSYADAFFPLALLNGAASDNFVFGHQVFQSLPIFLTGTLLCLILWVGRNWTVTRAMLAGILLILLVFCGSMGVVCAPMFACWFLVPVVLPSLARPDPSDPVTWPPSALVRVVMASSAGIAIVTAALYFVGFQDHYVVDGQAFPYHDPSPSHRATISTMIKFLSVGFGAPAYSFWPASGIFILGVYGVTGLVIAWCWLRGAADRLRIIGLACCLVGLGGLALGIGIGRASMGTDMAFSSRYVSLSALVVCTAYFVWVVANRQVGRLSQMVFFTIACASLAMNQKSGRDAAAWHLDPLAKFEGDLRAGLTPNALAARYTGGDRKIYTCRILPEASLQDEFVRLMRSVASPGHTLWGQLNDPATVDKSIAYNRPARVSDIEWSDDGTAKCVGNDPIIVYQLGQSLWVDVIRVEYSMAGVSPPAAFEAYWKNGDEGFTEKNSYRTSLPVQHEEAVLIKRSRSAQSADDTVWRKATATGEQARFQVTIPVNAWIDSFRIDPNDKPCTFKIMSIRLVLPKDSPVR